MQQKKAIIIGAGPAGLTAAYELLMKTDITPVVYEMSGDIGGISKTVNYKGNRIDIGGHRFFSKSDVVMRWWLNILPVQGMPSRDDIKLGRQIQTPQQSKDADPESSDRVMLFRNRLSRILYRQHFFDYPITLSFKTIANLGFWRTVKIVLSYLKAQIFTIKDEKSLEDFLINRFGRELYQTFFKDYTEKVWGRPCSEIKPEWGAQRIKGISISKVIIHAIKNLISKDTDVGQKKTETSLIERFLYPKFGPGQLWEEVAGIIKEKGGQIYLKYRIIGLENNGTQITAAKVRNEVTGETFTESGDYFFSSMPVRDLILGMGQAVPADVLDVAKGLLYRDFVVVGLLLKKLKMKNDTKIRTINNIVPDNWIYIQEKNVKAARLQIFNNWSPYMVNDENTVWIGLEYFCSEGDEFWNKSDEQITKLAIDEMADVNIIDKADVIDSTVIRMSKTYPGYFGSYDSFETVRKFTDRFENLYLIGRAGMHRYNNQDHSMLTAIAAVENIINNVKSKDNIWAINAEEEYHEEASS